MGKKLNRVHNALIEGAADGRTGTDLHDFVTQSVQDFEQAYCEGLTYGFD